MADIEKVKDQILELLDYGAYVGLMMDIWELLRDYPQIVRCKDCKHFEIKDHFADWNGIPILATSDCPTCNKWADGGCKTDPEGFCFLAERKET